MTRQSDLQTFYDLLEQQAEKIGGRQRMADLNMKSLPQRGVYFFFEDGERRSDTGTGPRVVRVGTHALKSGARSTLGQRLRQHRGANHGGGNHRGSIFRLLVGRALIRSRSQFDCRSWNVKGDLTNAAATLGMSREEIKEIEYPVEIEVSNKIGAMSVIYVEIADEPGPDSLRGYIERNSIALLSNRTDETLDPASPDWLGNFPDKPLVQSSGLWNQNHVDETYDPSFLKTLEHLISE